MAEEPRTDATDVATRIFSDFIDVLSTSGIASDVVVNLRKTLLEDRQFTERALKAALFPMDSQL